MATPPGGLRDQKKRKTREALRTAALRLALEQGPENVRVNDIAAAAGVSPRTYNNYFSSREQAIVAAVVADREDRIAAAVVARPSRVRLSTAVIEAVIAQYSDPGDDARDALLMVTTSATLRSSYVHSAATIEAPLAEAIVERSKVDPLTAEVLAASVGAAVKVALRAWIPSTTESPSPSGLVVPSGSVSDRLRTALAPLAPALDAAATRRS